MLPSAKQDVFRLLREDPKYNQYIHSLASYDPTLKGTQYNTGGIVSLTRTTPPERGPQHRGLDYLRKHGRGY